MLLIKLLPSIYLSAYVNWGQLSWTNPLSPQGPWVAELSVWPGVGVGVGVAILLPHVRFCSIIRGSAS